MSGSVPAGPARADSWSTPVLVRTHVRAQISNHLEIRCSAISSHHKVHVQIISTSILNEYEVEITWLRDGKDEEITTIDSFGQATAKLQIGPCTQFYARWRRISYKDTEN